MPQKLEIPLYGLGENEEQSIELNPGDAFGLSDETKVKTIEKERFPRQNMIKIGNVLEFDINTLIHEKFEDLHQCNPFRFDLHYP